MPYLIHFTPHPDRLHLAKQHFEAHVAYLDRHVDRILAAGSLRDESGIPVGGLVLLDVETRAEAEAFMAEEPFAMSGLNQSMTIVRWVKAYFDHTKLF